MISVDTSIIVRLLTGDDYGQAEKAHVLFKKSKLFIPETVILESEWVLRYAYGFGVAEIHTALSKLFGLPNVILSNPHRIQEALVWYSDGLDFADALHLASSQPCKSFFTFDHKFVQKAQGRSKCTVKEP
jgi:predicted nucleic-acid-binding protein